MVERRGLESTLIAGVLFGTSVPSIKFGLQFIPPETFVALRFLIASALITVFLRKQGWVRSDIFRSRPIWTLGFVNTAGYVTQFQGQQIVSSSNAALIISTAALMIPILALVHGHERIGRRKASGVTVGFVGTAMVVTRGEAFDLESSQFAGDLLIVFTALTIALVFVLSKKLVTIFGGRPVAGGIVFTTSLLLLPTIPLDQGRPLDLNSVAWLDLMFLSILATVGAYYFFMRGLESVSSIVSSIILPIEVIVAVLLSVALFNDPFNLYSGTGAVLILAGVILVSAAT